MSRIRRNLGLTGAPKSRLGDRPSDRLIAPIRNHRSTTDGGTELAWTELFGHSPGSVPGIGVLLARAGLHRSEAETVATRLRECTFLTAIVVTIAYQ